MPTFTGRRSIGHHAGKPPRHLKSDGWPEVIYAVGDVHGCYGELQELLELIRADGRGLVGEKWIVLLGDYVDRGPHSAAVLDSLLADEPGYRKIALLGNHERMLLDFIEEPGRNRQWLQMGGTETLQSYGIDTDGLSASTPGDIKAVLASHLPQDHLALLASLAMTLSVPGTIFVHASIRPGIPVAEQEEATLLWSRSPPPETAVPGAARVVHGHTPAREPHVSALRICVDTGAYATGVLTAARLTPDGACTFLQTSARPAAR